MIKTKLPVKTNAKSFIQFVWPVKILCSSKIWELSFLNDEWLVYKETLMNLLEQAKITDSVPGNIENEIPDTPRPTSVNTYLSRSENSSAKNFFY